MFIRVRVKGFALEKPDMHLDGVSAVRGSGCVAISMRNQQSLVNLNVDESATADGTDPFKYHVHYFEATIVS